MLASSYDSLLVLFSLLVAVLASYTALDMAGRIASAQRRVAWCWLAGGSVAMGTGIWSMHFVGMLAFSLPIPLGYDPTITVLSLLIAIASSAFALWLVARTALPWSRLVGGALLMGAGIAAMHYTGMAAMRMTPAIRYSPSLFILSIVVAIVASGTALWITFHLRRVTSRGLPLRAGAAAVMGCAIAGMHYIGMDAARIQAGSLCGAARGGVDTGWLALVVIIVTLAVFAITLVTSVLDVRLESRTAILADSLAQANQELTRLALHDSLTGLPNRLLLEDRLERAIQTAIREKSSFTLMFMDLDGFKTVNDAYGHRIGDLLLAEVAQRIGSVVRSRDTLARVGGDEFVLVAEASRPEDSASIAEKVLAAVAEPFHAGGRLLRISTSIGIAIYPNDGAHQDELLTNADAAMYHAKASGRNAYCFFEASMNANVHEQLQLVHDLRLALERRALILQYQPKFTAADGRVVGVEALVRWLHPTRGLIGPDHFIPLAEKTGLIVPIGEWVLDEACRQISEWRNAGQRHWTMAVNLSALQLGHAGLIQTVRNALQLHALNAQCLTLEVTESTAMRDEGASLKILRELRDMGVRISIDDFGTGYSSLLNLKRLPASELKIDRGFVRELAPDTDDAAIIAAIVTLGRTLRLNIVAEGVETAVQQELLTRLGCDSVQGFLLGRPMSADQIIARFSERDTVDDAT